MTRALVIVGLSLVAASCESQPLIFPDAASGAPVSPAGSGGEAGEGSEVGGASGEGGTEPAGGTGGEPFVEPLWLSETGLFADIITDKLAEGVMPFSPRYELWSDEASKRRWILLPEGTQIDSADMDYWRYPVGTKVWKEFTNSNRRIETRLLQKLDDQRWFMMAFQWNAETTDAFALPEGQENTRNLSHDIPSTEQCARCHEMMPDVLLGATALQLSHDGDGLTLDTLIEEGKLSVVPEEPLLIPGSETERDALGYLHANCGMCHQPESVVSAEVALELWVRADELGSLEATGPYRTAVGESPMLDDFPEATALVEPGDPEHSVLFLRMSSRDGEMQMPPLGTEFVDPDGVAAVQAWIESLAD